MPKRPAVHSLPEDVKGQLDRRLIAGGFSGYQELADWLREQGFELSRSALHRYGQQFENRLAALKIATEQARAITEAVGDEEGVMGDALTRLAQEKAFQVLVEMEDAGEVSLPKLGRMIADLNRTSIAQKKWMAEMRKKAAAAAESVVKTARQGGLSDEKAEEIRKKILGIV